MDYRYCRNLVQIAEASTIIDLKWFYSSNFCYSLHFDVEVLKNGFIIKKKLAQSSYRLIHHFILNYWFFWPNPHQNHFFIFYYDPVMIDFLNIIFQHSCSREVQLPASLLRTIKQSWWDYSLVCLEMHDLKWWLSSNPYHDLLQSIRKYNICPNLIILWYR